MAKPCAAECNTGETIDISISIPIAERRLEFDFGAVVTRANQVEQELAGVFVYLKAATEAAIAANFASRAAWLWHQPNSALTQWFHHRTEGQSKRVRCIMIVALARKLSIALWRYVELGPIPEGAVVK